jgi:hypothetical protein
MPESLQGCVVKVVSLLEEEDFDGSSCLVNKLRKLGAQVRSKYIKTLSHVVLCQAVHLSSSQRLRNEDALARVFHKLRTVRPWCRSHCRCR